MDSDQIAAWLASFDAPPLTSHLGAGEGSVTAALCCAQCLQPVQSGAAHTCSPSLDHKELSDENTHTPTAR